MTEKPSAILRFNKSKDGIHVKVLASRGAVKLIKSVSGVEYQSKSKEYYLPVEQISSLIKRFQDKNQVILVEQEAKDYLLETQDLRSRIINREHQPTATELKDCLLFPMVQKNPGDTYSLKSASTKKLKLLMPGIAHFNERKQFSSKLKLQNLSEVIWRARLANLRIWLSKEVRNDLLALRNKHLTSLKRGFGEWVLGVITPERCFTLDLNGKPVLILKGRHTSQDLKTLFFDYAEDPFWETLEEREGLTIVTLYDSKLLEIFEFEEFVAIPTTDIFFEYLEKVRYRLKILSERDRFNQLKDFDLRIDNQALAKKLYPHQRVAIAWILKQPYCFIADDMGLGKTLSVLTAFQEVQRTKSAELLLVICPNSLVLNWTEEVKRWMPELQSAITPDTKTARINFLKKIKEGILNPDVLVINYEEARLVYVASELAELTASKKTFLCLDESQRVKNPLSITFKAIVKLVKYCPRRVLLSGTPSPRDFSDLWSQQFLLDQGERFGSNYYEWLEQVAELGSKWSRFSVKSFKPQAVQEYLYRFQELLLRRKKTEVINLPPKIFMRRDLKLSGDQLVRYDQIREDLLVQLTNLEGEAYKRSIDNILEQFLRAVQIASNPRIIDSTWKGEPVKFLELDQIVEEAIAQEQKLVIWTNFTENIRELVVRYKEYQARPYYGEIKPVDRQKYVNEFQSSEAGRAKILIAIPAAGGVGINLTAASSAVYLDKTWNAEHWLQSIDRIYRIGQTNSVNIISLNACSIDYIISKNLKKKQELLNQVMDAKEVDFQPLYPTQAELISVLK